MSRKYQILFLGLQRENQNSSKALFSQSERCGDLSEGKGYCFVSMGYDTSNSQCLSLSRSILNGYVLGQNEIPLSFNTNYS